MAEFEAFPKIPRLNRDIVITEKIDGTNAAVIISDPYGPTARITDPEVATENGIVETGGQIYRLQAQSRKRLITPGKATDNYGFAGWVQQNAKDLIDLLGPGRHFGEWWGTGIQHGYGLASQRRFSLFNVKQYGPRPDWAPFRTPPAPGMLNDTIIDVVPVLYEGPFLQPKINGIVTQLRNMGSVAAPGWSRPEGVIVYHTAAGQLFKVTCENDDKPKEVVARETAKVAANGGGKVDFS